LPVFRWLAGQFGWRSGAAVSIGPGDADKA
jgi:hypothetical protein